MAKSLSPALSHSRPAAVRASVREERSGPTLPPLQVRYYRRMHRQRVYAVTVSWHNKDERRPPAGTGPVLLRLLMAGAQVVPSEQPLDPARRDARATFYVTPLARGWLRGERLEVLVDGRKVQEMPLMVNVSSQKMTWVLLALTILVPWCLLTYFKGPLVEPMVTATGQPPIGQMGQMPMGQMPKGKMPKGKMPKGPMQKAEVPDGQMAAGEREKRRPPRSSGEVLEARIKENVPAVPEFINENVPAVRDSLLDARRFLADVYDTVLRESVNNHLAFYAGSCLLFLTIISWWVHKEKRKRRVGMPIPLPGGATVPLAAEG